MIKPLKILFISTPVGPLGSGLGGGVELTLNNIACEMIRRGHQLQVVAPENSSWDLSPIVQVPGNLQILAQNQERSTPIVMPEDSVLANMWEYAYQNQSDRDLIVNFAYDWLPFYLTPFFQCPIAHLVSMGSLSNALDKAITQVTKVYPGTVGFHTPSQAATFPDLNPPFHYLSNGLDLSLYKFCSQPKKQLAWLGRISPEKGVEDAIVAAEMANIPLKIMGKIQDELYWQKICQRYSDTSFEYLGFLSTFEMQQVLRECQALLMTPHWVEAFGNVVIESLACGVPVISYSRGGPADIIQDGKTGFLVEPDKITELVAAISRIDEINRYTCRTTAETEFSLQALGDRCEKWFGEILVESRR